MKKQFISAALALLCALPVIASCASQADTQQKDSGDVTIAQTEEGEETVDLSYTDGLGNYDFDGRTFNILLYGDGVPKNWSVVDMVTDEQTGEVINDAIIDRNRDVEERFDAVIAGVYDASAASTISRTVRSGDDAFSIVWLQMAAAGSAAQEGLFIDYNNLPQVDTSKSYWDGSLIDDLSIGGRIYYLTGDLSTIDNQATWMMLFNKNMVASYGIDSPYELVNSGKWVIDKFAAMVKDITFDIDGNGKFDKYDQYGLSTTADTIYGLFYSCGERFATKDEDDYPVFNFDTEKAADILDKTIDIMCNDNSALVSGRITNSSDVITDIRNAFEEDRALFYAEVMFHIAMLRQMETDFGIIPMPKYDEGQANYITFVNPAATLVSVPITVQDTEFPAVILEAMAAASYKYMTPAYYDIALKGKYARDDESSAMLDLLLINRAYDLGLVYGWGSLPAEYNSLAYNGKPGLASLIAKKEKQINSAIEKFVDAFSDL